ncbi:MAG: hypothetical protein ACR2KT_14275 [Methylocella sp.]
MAAKEIIVKKYIVLLSDDEREQNATLIRKGSSQAQRLMKAVSKTLSTICYVCGQPLGELTSMGHLEKYSLEAGRSAILVAAVSA